MTPKSQLETVAANLASLNEIVAEILLSLERGEAPDPEYVTVAVDVLRRHSHDLGYEFMGDVPAAHRVRRWSEEDIPPLGEEEK